VSKPLPPLPVGTRFGHWKVAGESFLKDASHRVVPCVCKCGTRQDVLVFALRNGKSQSCGCLKREQVATLAQRTLTTHGRAGGDKDPLYRLWLRINKRCYNPQAHNYRWYGARGISVWEPWRHDAGTFIAYIEHNLGPRPTGHSLDRQDNDGNYEPGNLRWATAAEQARNRRKANSPSA